MLGGTGPSGTLIQPPSGLKKIPTKVTEGAAGQPMEEDAVASAGVPVSQASKPESPAS